jgi:hypothetical protein
MDRSEHEDRLKASATATTKGGSTTKVGTTKVRQRSKGLKSTTSTNTILVVLLGLFFVGQIFLAMHPDPALSSTSSSSFLDPAAMKVSHHLAKQQQIGATTASSPLESEVLGPKEPPHSQGEYETLLMKNESSPSALEKNVKYATTTASTPMKITTTVPTTTASIPTASTAPVEAAPVANANKNSGNSDSSKSSSSNPLMTMLHKAGLTNISQADLDTLPTWESLTRQYGDLEQGPVMVGMDSCERYRQQTVHHRRRYAAPAGMFNTGTNAVAFHLEHNLQALQKWQVPWGKHRMESVRLTHIAPGFEKAILQDAMPIVMIRDPLHWMQSMVRNVLLRF